MLINNEKDIVIISNYFHFPSQKSSSRYLSIVNGISNEYANVELVISDFYHATKKKRDLLVNESLTCKYVILHESGYNKNISIRRIISHAVFSTNVLKYLKKRKKPDLIYLFVPPLNLGKKIVKYCNQHNIKIIIDVLDLWPEAFKLKFSLPFVSNLLFLPYKNKADYIYRNANASVSVSETYKNRIVNSLQDVTDHSRKDIVIYIGAEERKFKNIKVEQNLKKMKGNSFWVLYLGTIGHSYDIKVCIDAIKLLSKDNYRNINLILVGSGPLENKFKEMSKSINNQVKFVGQKSFNEVVQYLLLADVVVNPIKMNASQSITNKLSDYLCSGNAILNTHDNPEVMEIISSNKCGINSSASNAMELKENIIKLYLNNDEILKMQRNSKSFALKNLYREKTYRKILDLIREVIIDD